MSEPRDQILAAARPHHDPAEVVGGIACRCGWIGDDWLAHVADALLPIVERREDEAAARALEDVATGLDYTPLSERESGQVSDWTQAWHAAAVVLRANARALRDPGRAQAGERQ